MSLDQASREYDFARSVAKLAVDLAALPRSEWESLIDEYRRMWAINVRLKQLEQTIAAYQAEQFVSFCARTQDEAVAELTELCRRGWSKPEEPPRTLDRRRPADA